MKKIHPSTKFLRLSEFDGRGIGIDDIIFEDIVGFEDGKIVDVTNPDSVPFFVFSISHDLTKVHGLLYSKRTLLYDGNHYIISKIVTVNDLDLDLTKSDQYLLDLELERINLNV